MSITGNQCAVTVTAANIKDKGTWDIHIGAGKNFNDFLKDNTHHIKSVVLLSSKIFKRHICAGMLPLGMFQYVAHNFRFDGIHLVFLNWCIRSFFIDHECTVQDGLPGSCVIYFLCSPLLQLISNLRRPISPEIPSLMQQNLLCGRENVGGLKLPKVCCPTEEPPKPKTDEER